MLIIKICTVIQIVAVVLYLFLALTGRIEK